MNAMLKDEVKKIMKAVRQLHTTSNDECERDEALSLIAQACDEEQLQDRKYHDSRKKK